LVELEPHDWVVLDRVICCYAHLDQLLANAIGAARQRFVMSVPLSTGWRSLITKAIVTVENATNVLRGRPCPGYVHSVPLIERRLAGAGFRRLRQRRVGLWHVAVYEKVAA
jgi:magnesium-protoporphyrin O-methyltransferase